MSSSDASRDTLPGADYGASRLRPAAGAAASAGLLRAGTWRRRRDGASVHGGGRGRAAQRGIATLRYQFPSMERGSKRPDPPKLAQAAVRAAVAEARRLLPELPLVAGGKSFGGRMTSQAQAAAPLAGVRGLAFLGFPLHPAGRPSQDRGQHLFDVTIPSCSCRGRATRSRSWRSSSRSARCSASARPCSSLRTPIIPFTCRHGPAARMRRSVARCWTRSPPGSPPVPSPIKHFAASCAGYWTPRRTTVTNG